MGTLIIIRGNSGSGKTTVAKAIHTILGEGSLLVSQDYVRRIMLNVKDRPNNISIELIETMLMFGLERCDYTILEGILSNHIYSDMLSRTIQKADRILSYYYDLPFKETVKRHSEKETNEFDEADMKRWFIPHDYLEVENENIIDEDVSKDDMIKLILNDIN